jgi:hypothetical protein
MGRKVSKLTYENDVAKAIREHTAYQKGITDSITEVIKFIVIGVLVAFLITGLIIFIPAIINYIFPQHYETTTVAPTPSPFTQNHIINQNMSKKIDDYQRWCMHNGIWSTSDSSLPICTNQYGDKIKP